MADEKRYDIDDILNELRDAAPAAQLPAEQAVPEQPTEAPIPAEQPAADAPVKPKFELHLDLDDEYGELPEENAADEDDEPVRIYGEEPLHIEEEPETEQKTEPEASKAFELHLNLDDEYESIPEPIPTLQEQEPVRILDEEEPAPPPTKKKRRLEGWGCLFATLYGTVVMAVSVFLAYTLIVGFLDFTGIGKEEVLIDITVPQNVTNEQLADILETEGLIDEGWIFRIYAKLVKGEGNWQPGEYSLTPNMGYQTLSRRLRTATPREVVRVTIPEGFTVPQIAARMAEYGVCTEEEFMAALDVDYSKDYDFIADLRTVSSADRDARVHELEGYLFPDTYDFYKGCSGETVVRKMLSNFDSRMSTQFRAAAKEQGLTIDQVVILASIVQGEANNPDDMAGVARVFFNRLSNPALFPRLESDATGEYLVKLFGDKNAVAGNETYNTYNREGLPVGAINCPGEDAIRAVLWPAEDKELTCTCTNKGSAHNGESANGKKYFFATYYKLDDNDVRVAVTGYHTTLEAHEKFCDEYDIHD